MSLTNIKRLQKEKGFTIVELLIVIVVIAILAAIVLVAYNGIQNSARTTAAKAAAQTVLKKVEAYNAEEGSYPDAPADLTGADPGESYFLDAGEVSIGTTDIAAAPANQNTVDFSTCGTPQTGVEIGYWDYSGAGSRQTMTAGTGC